MLNCAGLLNRFCRKLTRAIRFTETRFAGNPQERFVLPKHKARKAQEKLFVFLCLFVAIPGPRYQYFRQTSERSINSATVVSTTCFRQLRINYRTARGTKVVAKDVSSVTEKGVSKAGKTTAKASKKIGKAFKSSKPKQ